MSFNKLNKEYNLAKLKDEDRFVEAIDIAKVLHYKILCDM